jgi:Secretion system C-terminal sorting domain
MYKNIYLLVIMSTSILPAGFSQNVSVNPGAGAYPTLAGAFAAINAGAHTGAITVNIVNNTAETVSAVLNASGTGAASYTGITIQPAGGATRTITGAIAGHLIDLNGADNVTIDGLQTAGNNLVIQNTSTAFSASTIRFVNDASDNRVTNCTVSGATGNANALGLGVIYFHSGITTGNDNNSISFCKITPVAGGFPVSSIHSAGTSAAIDNSGISIANNQIYDYFTPAASSHGIRAGLGSSGWTISGNSFYQTTPKTYTFGSTHYAINIAAGSGYVINDNAIGGSGPNGGGSAYSMSGDVAIGFIGINLAAGTTSAISNIQGNTIGNIIMNTTNIGSFGAGIFCCINVTAGNVNIGTVTGNAIGAATGVDNIRTTSTNINATLVGINCSSTGSIAIQNNSIGALTNSGITAPVGGNVTGINISGVATSVTISGNTIGNATPNNIRGGGILGFTTGSSEVAGISLPSAPAVAVINNNTIRNLYSIGAHVFSFARGIQTGTASSATATNWSISNNTISDLYTNSTRNGNVSGLCPALGIYHASSQGCIISQNTISNIANINTASISNSVVAGIVSGNATVATTLGTVIIRNQIWGLGNATQSTSALSPPIAAGIVVASGNNITAINNNMVSLGNGQSTNTSFIGIWCQNASAAIPTVVNIYHNNVQIEGAVTTGAIASFAFIRGRYSGLGANAVTVDVKNNIFQNVRAGGTGQHFAISNGFGEITVSTIGWPANAADYNALNANAATIGHWTTAHSFAGWRTASVSDANSIAGFPAAYVNSAAGDLHLVAVSACSFDGAGVPVGITTDFDNQPRNTNHPDIGADEVDAPFVANSAIAGTIAAGAVVNEATSKENITGTTNFVKYCKQIATLTPSGVSPVAGTVVAGVRVDTGATKMGTARLHVARFFDLLPASNAATATGTVKLYFLQSEFDNYNSKALDSNYYPLPLTSGGNTDSLRILIYHGAPSGGFLPGNYAGTTEALSTADAGVTVVWNAAGNNGTGWWEVSFPANGFSGYFVSSKPRPPLPVTVEYFRGAKSGSSHHVTWKVSCTNTPFATMTLERSTDGRNFGGIYTITASAVRCLQAFDYADVRPLTGINYYRLKMADADGKVTYSTIVALTTATKGFEVINITPNPVTEGRFKLNITAAEQVKMEVVITDIAGRVVATQSNTLIAGFNAIDVNVNKLANGTYQVTGVTAEGRTKTMQFVKQ